MKIYFSLFIKKRSITHAVFLLFVIGLRSSQCFSQDFVNNGDVISNLNGNIIFVNGNISDLSNGTFENTGSIYLTGDWTNNAGNPAFTITPGGTVLMVGATQNIQGSSVTEFYNLTLSGSGVKQLTGIDAIVKNTLNLNDRELSTNTNTAFVTNTSLNAITRTSGFVSSLGNGALVRSMASTGTYLFPVGSSIAPARYRPVDIVTATSSANAFAVRLANTEATNEGFNIFQKQSTIQNVNPLYYHRIRRDSGSTAADITIYFDAVLDGNFAGIAHWQNQPQWEDINAGSASGNYGLSALSKQVWNDFSPDAFALINDECGEFFVPTAFSPNNDGQNDFECVYGKCIETLLFSIYDRWGEKVFETEDKNLCWDGKYRGKLMNTGVFVYTLHATFKSGQEITKKGNIGLVR
ncbi:MAG: gliding motility-associated C-terminal domain-containing protein [Bacteroidetes bacterium]|nr:gliding motility-associated C-terminal domain-containing protein [Bacteroidota bacterium]